MSCFFKGTMQAKRLVHPGTCLSVAVCKVPDQNVPDSFTFLSDLVYPQMWVLLGVGL